jgi:alpha-ketoglutarate-dependent taurine dioxygenase
MVDFYGVPVMPAGNAPKVSDYLLEAGGEAAKESTVITALREDKLVLIKHLSQAAAGDLFAGIVDYFGLRNSYDVQMKFVVHMLEDRAPVDDIAVTVNDRGPYQIIQPHSEGDSTSPLELIALYCHHNAEHGGENVFSLVNQAADHSALRAKEKYVVGKDVSAQDLQLIRQLHRDVAGLLDEEPEHSRVLYETETGKVVVTPRHLTLQRSVVNDRDVVTYWDNVTVHDHAFHEHQYALLSHLRMLRAGLGNDYERYMHVEVDSDWAPADTRSGQLEYTAKLFSHHVVHKMQPGELLIANNRVWTHAVNNWEPGEQRRLVAMYA